MSAKGNFAKTGDDECKNVAIVSKLQLDLLKKVGYTQATKQTQVLITETGQELSYFYC